MTRRTRTSTVRFALAALLLAGCGADPAATDDGATSSPSPAAAPTDAAPTDAATTEPGDGHDMGGMTEGDHDDMGGMTEGDHDDMGGGADDDAEVDRVIEVEMSEFAFTPAAHTAAVGETVRFTFTNGGAVEHEAVLGPQHVQDEHEEAMKAGGTMSHGHGSLTVTLAPGETGDITVTFDEAGELFLGCHIPGHWDAGMMATITVAE